MDIVINTTSDQLLESYEEIPHRGNYYHHLLTCLGYPDDKPPVADLLRQYHDLDGQWLVASPVHWQVTHNDAMIMESGDSLLLSEQDLRGWFDIFQEWMQQVDIKVYYHSASIWLIQCDGKPMINAKPVYALHNQSLMPELRQLDSTLYWQRMITECQMFFGEHLLNKKRTTLETINGLWFWGEGELHEKVSVPIFYREECSMKLGQILSDTVSPLIDSPPDDSVCLFTHFDPADGLLFKKGRHKKPICWYWNNLAYIERKKRKWFLWGLDRK